MDDHYSYGVTWSAEDGEYVGTCAEFPSLSHLGPSQSDALAGIADLVAGVVKDMSTNGEALPTPFADRTFSGAFMTRVPPDLHRRLAIEAAASRVSLNRLVSFKLALPTGVAAPRPKRAGGTSR